MRIPEWISPRLEQARLVLWRPALKVGGPIIVFIGLLSSIRAETEWIPEPWRDQPILKWLPVWPWYVWVIIALVLLWIVTLEGAYRLYGRPLDLRISDFVVFLRDENESKDFFFSNDISRALMLLGLEITNRTTEQMLLDFTVTLSLIKPSFLRKRSLELCRPHLRNLDQKYFKTETVTVPAKDAAREVNLAFEITALQIKVIRGLENLSKGKKQVLILTDHVSGRSYKALFAIDL